MTVSDVVDSAINTILSLQKTENEIDSYVSASQKYDVKVEPTTSEKPDIMSTFAACRTEEISKIKNGWTLEDCGSLTIGEMYLMVSILNIIDIKENHFWGVLVWT